MKIIFLHDIDAKLDVWPFCGAIVGSFNIKSGTGQEEVDQIDKEIKDKFPELLNQKGYLKPNITYSFKESIIK